MGVAVKEVQVLQNRSRHALRQLCWIWRPESVCRLLRKGLVCRWHTSVVRGRVWKYLFCQPDFYSHDLRTFLTAYAKQYSAAAEIWSTTLSRHPIVLSSCCSAGSEIDGFSQ